MISRHIIIFLSLVSFLFGCASTHTPNQNLLAMSQSMSREEAINIVKNALVTPAEKSGICGGSGLPSGETFYKDWEINTKNPDLAMSKKGFNVNAYRREPTTYLSGNVSAPIATTSFNTTQQFRQSINFEDIEYIRIFSKKGLVYRMCYIHDGHSGVMMGLSNGWGYFFGITIKKSNLEQFIAAMMVLAPKAKLQKS